MLHMLIKRIFVKKYHLLNKRFHTHIHLYIIHIDCFSSVALQISTFRLSIFPITRDGRQTAEPSA